LSAACRKSASGRWPDRKRTRYAIDLATIAHQLRSHDDYVPLTTPLPMHVARLAADYVLPTDQDQQND
jgi:hypothetical protein